MYKKKSYTNIIEVPEGYNEIISPLERIALVKKYKDKHSSEPKRILFATINSVIGSGNNKLKKSILIERVVDGKNSWKGYHQILYSIDYGSSIHLNNLECTTDGYKKNNDKMFEKFIKIDLELLKVNKKLVEEEKKFIEKKLEYEKKGYLNNGKADLLEEEEYAIKKRKFEEIKNYIISVCNPNHKRFSKKELNRRFKRLVAAELMRQFYPITEEFLNLYNNGKVEGQRIILKQIKTFI